MVHYKKVTLVVEKWTALMAAELSTIDADCDVSWYQANVEAKILTAIGVYHGLARVGSVLTRVDGNEFVFVAGAGRADFDLIVHVVPLLEQMAIDQNCNCVRLHTRRKGMVEKARRQGFDAAEIVLRKAVS